MPRLILKQMCTSKQSDVQVHKMTTRSAIDFITEYFENVSLAGSTPPIEDLIGIIVNLGQNTSLNIRIFELYQVGLPF